MNPVAPVMKTVDLSMFSVAVVYDRVRVFRVLE
jgi:hypothetical protein